MTQMVRCSVEGCGVEYACYGYRYNKPLRCRSVGCHLPDCSRRYGLPEDNSASATHKLDGMINVNDRLSKPAR